MLIELLVLKGMKPHWREREATRMDLVWKLLSTGFLVSLVLHLVTKTYSLLIVVTSERSTRKVGNDGCDSEKLPFDLCISHSTRALYLSDVYHYQLFCVNDNFSKERKIGTGKEGFKGGGSRKIGTLNWAYSLSHHSLKFHNKCSKTVRVAKHIHTLGLCEEERVGPWCSRWEWLKMTIR
jgi:hypothetical protein